MQKKVEKRILKILNKALSEQEKNTKELTIANLHDLTRIYKELHNIKEETEEDTEAPGVIILPAVDLERMEQYEQD